MSGRISSRRGQILVLLLLLAVFATTAIAQVNVKGQWSTQPNIMPINPVHVALLPNGKILVVAGSGNCPPSQAGCPSGAPYNQAKGAGALLWDPAIENYTQWFSLSWDMFCNGMTLLSDGRVLIDSGTLQYDPFFGDPKTAIFDPATNTFTNTQNMAHGRWYPTVVTLGDGRVMTFSGLDNTGGTNKAVEFYTNGSGWSQEFIAPFTPDLYPRLHLLPNGNVFYSSPGSPSAMFFPSSTSWNSNFAATNYGNTRTYGTSVLLPLTPANNYDPRVIIMGGGNPATATTEVIDLGAATPKWQFGPNMSQARIEMNAVILPNGKVLALGGSVNDEDTGSLSLNADLYDPASNTFSSAGANASQRLYHSVALLLPDATVWVAGGNPSRGTYNNTVEVYQPAYLFNSNGTLATRPAITSAPTGISYGNNFSVVTPDAATITSVVLVRNGAVTHAFGMDQREVGLSFTAGSGSLTVTGPPNSNIAPPGYYMLFLLNSAGVPSVATFVQLGVQLPPVPTNLNATPGSTQVGLTWTASAGATSYNVKRSATNGGPYSIIASPATNSYTDTGLTNGATYYYVVSALNGAGETANSSQVSATPQLTIPPVPTTLAATAGNTQVALSWTASPGAVSYNVKRSTTNGGPYTTIAGPTTNSYTDTGLTNGTTYYYVVSAVNSLGESANSGQASATPAAPTTYFGAVSNTSSGTPLGTGIDDLGGYVVQLDGTASQAACIGTGTATVMEMGTYASVTSGTSHLRMAIYGPVDGTHDNTLVAQTAELTFTNTSLAWIEGTSFVDASGTPITPTITCAATPGTKYKLFVLGDGSSHFGFGNAGTSNNYQSTNLAWLTTGYPSPISWGPISQGSEMPDIRVGVSYGIPGTPTNLSATPGNAQVALSWTASTGATSYNVKRSTTSGGPYTNIASPTTNSYTDTGLTNGMPYFYVVSALNGSGESANSSQVSATPQLTAPPMPTNLAATAGSGQVALSWTASTGAASYNVKRSATNGGPYTTVASPTTNSYTDTGLTNGTTYFYVVSAVNTAGESANSSQVSSTPIAVPAPPTNLAATAGNAQVALSWTASTGATSYNVKRSTINGGPYTTVASPTSSSYTDTGLTNGTPYYYVVSAVNTAGESANSSQASATPVAIPATPTNLAATAGSGQVALSWTAPTGATSYNVKRSTTTGGPYTTVASPTTNSYTDTGLTNGTTYFYVVSAVNSAGESANSSQVSSTPISVPAPPTNLAATPGSGLVALTWTASTGAASYNVKRSTTTGGPYTTVAGPTTNSYTDTGLTNGLTYYYVVSAVNTAGESANSAQVSATPQLAVPPPPTNLTATGGSAQVSLNWTASVGAASYNVKRSTTTGGPYTTIASPTTNTYTDTGLTNGTPYYYVVSAVNASGESGNSSQATATPGAATTYFGAVANASTGTPLGTATDDLGGYVVQLDSAASQAACIGTGTKTIVEMGTYASVKSGTSNLRIAIYGPVDGTHDNTLVAQTAKVSFNNTSLAWIEATSFLNASGTAITPTIACAASPGTKYKLLVIGDGASLFGYGSGGTKNYFQSTNLAWLTSGYPSPLSWGPISQGAEMPDIRVGIR